MNNSLLEKTRDTLCFRLYQDRTKGKELFTLFSIMNYGSKCYIINTSFLSSIPDLRLILIYVI